MDEEGRRRWNQMGCILPRRVCCPERRGRSVMWRPRVARGLRDVSPLSFSSLSGLQVCEPTPKRTLYALRVSPSLSPSPLAPSRSPSRIPSIQCAVDIPGHGPLRRRTACHHPRSHARSPPPWPIQLALLGRHRIIKRPSIITRISGRASQGTPALRAVQFNSILSLALDAVLSARRADSISTRSENLVSRYMARACVPSSLFSPCIAPSQRIGQKLG